MATGRWPLMVLLLGLVTVGVLAAAKVGLQIANARMEASRGTADPTPFKITILDHALIIPGNMIRFSDQRRSATLERVDLFALWPKMEGLSRETGDRFDNPSASREIVFISIEPRREALDTTDRLAPVYSRFFAGTARLDPSGLVVRGMASGSGYELEDIVYDPHAERRPFVARCLQASAGAAPATCMRELNLSEGLAVSYRFHRSRLANWRLLDRRVVDLIATFRDEV